MESNALKENSHKWRPLTGPLVCLVLVSASLPFLLGLYPIVRFTSEEIFITVRPGLVEVTGHYHYRNPLPFTVVQGLSVPYPTDELHPRGELLSITRLGEGGESAALAYSTVFGIDRFEVPFKGDEEVTVIVRYTQRSLTDDGVYLLSTTAPWGRPLERGLYRIEGDGVIITASNYKATPKSDGAWEFTKSEFMPEDDWRFKWEVL